LQFLKILKRPSNDAPVVEENALMKHAFYISTDKSKLDVERIYRYLSGESYWANGRSIDVVRRSIENSICFGVFKGNEQVGFARIVSDCAVFAWILDLFILENYRGHGLSKLLMETIMGHPDLQNLQRWGLATEDAHGLYEQYGFTKLTRPETFMERTSKPS
jgi:GNAT superfamily N-acetyltransferase